jgi:hypothetical protein
MLAQVARYLPLFDLKAGMVLARPVLLSERGMVILSFPGGQMLTPAHLEQLAAHHAEVACVFVEPSIRDADYEKYTATQKERMATLFRNANLEDPLTQAFFDRVFSFRSQQCPCR